MSVQAQGQVNSEQGDLEQRFIALVTEARGQLSANDEQLVAYVRQTLPDLAFHTSDSLAEEAGVSRAAVVRFARKLGFAGFLGLRDFVRDELQGRGESPLKRLEETVEANSLDRKFYQDGQNLASTQSLIRSRVGEAAERLHRAKSIYIAANRKSYGLAVYFHRLLHGLRPSVHLIDPGFPDDVAYLSADDTLVAFVFRRYSRATLALLEEARETGAGIVILTDGGAHDFVKDGDCALPAATDTTTPFQSMVAPLAVLEALAAETALLDPDEAKRSLTRTERFAHTLGLLREG